MAIYLEQVLGPGETSRAVSMGNLDHVVIGGASIPSATGILEGAPVETVPATVPAVLPQPAADDALGALKSVAEVGTLFLALSYVGGWSFMASYYLAFGISPYELDFSVPATSAFALHVLRQSGWPLLGLAFLFVGLAVLYGRLGRARRAWAGVFIAFFLFAVAATGSSRGRRLAAEDILDTSLRLPNVGFISKAATQEPDCLAKGTTDCKLLLHAKGEYYFFEPISGGSAGSMHGKNFTLYIVADSEVSSAEIVRGLE